jgi:hypothetical protein
MWATTSQTIAQGKLYITHPIRNRPAHTSNHNNTPAIPKPNHLFRSRLTRHKHTRHINFKHAIRIFGTILQGGSFLLNSCGGD